MSSNPSPSGAAVSAEQLEQTTRAISQKLDALRAEQRSLRRIMILGSLLLVCTMLVFGWKLWSYGHETYTKEKLQLALEGARPGIEPELKDRAQRFYDQLAPVYTQAALSRWDVIRPQIQSRFAEEANLFPSKLQDKVNVHVDAAFKRVESNVRKSLDKELPTLAFEKLGDVHELIKGSLATQAQKMHERLEKLYKMELSRFQRTLEKFPVPDATAMDRAALQKRFLHELIQLVDHEIFVFGTPEGLNLENIKLELKVGNPNDPVTGPAKPAATK